MTRPSIPAARAAVRACAYIYMSGHGLLAAAEPPALAIVNARIETIARGTISSGTLLIEGGRIAAVGPRVEIPPDVRIIDAAGGTVTPGLIASSTNLAVAEINLVAETRDDAAGERVGAGFEIHYGVNPASTQIPIARATGVTHAIITPLLGRAEAFAGEHDHGALLGGGDDGAAGPVLFAGQAAILRLAHAERSPVMRPRAAVALDLGQAGAQHAGGSRGASIVLTRAALADARHLLRNRAAYERGETRPYSLPAYDLEALIPVIERRTPLLVRASRASDIRLALAFAREERVRIILEDAQEGWLVADEIAAAQVPVILDPQESLPRSFESLGARLDNAALLQRAGVLIAIKGSRNFNSLRPVRFNAGTAVAYGLAYADALAAITLNPARIWGMAERTGSIEPGKDADVVIWSGDPLEPLTDATSVIIGGLEQPTLSRRRQLEQRYLSPETRYPPAYR